MTIYERALEFIQEGDVVGLGSGRASTEFIRLLGQRVQGGASVIAAMPEAAAALIETAAAEPVAILAEEAHA